nr:HepT-like ribonuclease domain-containing protein [Leptolyngbya sp. FACHB-36]
MEAIDPLDRYATQGRQAFEQNELIQVWFIQNLQIIGEASRFLSSSIRSRYSDVPWSEIIGMRNILTHNYFEIDLDIVWQAVERNLPNLKLKIEAILQTWETEE